MPPAETWRGFVLLVGLVWPGHWLWRRRVASAVGGRWRAWPRSLRPRPPHDCPSCRAALEQQRGSMTRSRPTTLAALLDQLERGLPRLVAVMRTQREPGHEPR